MVLQFLKVVPPQNIGQDISSEGMPLAEHVFCEKSLTPYGLEISLPINNIGIEMTNTISLFSENQFGLYISEVSKKWKKEK